MDEKNTAYVGKALFLYSGEDKTQLDELTRFSPDVDIKSEDIDVFLEPDYTIDTGIEPLEVFQVLEQLDKLDWEPVVMGADGLLAGVMQAYPQRVAELNRMYVTDLYADIGEFVSLPTFVEQVVGMHKQMFSGEASTDTALGVEGYQVIKFAINRCPDRNNGNCINREIRSIKNLQGIVSSFSILANGKASRPIYVNTIQDGQLKLVVKVN